MVETKRVTRLGCVVGLLATSCASEPSSGGGGTATDGVTDPSTTTVATTTTTTENETSETTTGLPSTGTTTSSGGSSDASGDGPRFDLQVADMGAPVDICKVNDDMNGVADCIDVAPPDAFEAVLQWSFMGQDGDVGSSTTPLVANLTDDNDDGEVDLCDIPDVVVAVWPSSIYVLDGATGSVHWSSDIPVANFYTPAIGDIDADGLPEIVTANTTGQPIAFNHDGTLAWMGAAAPIDLGLATAVALVDLDNDGDVEILIGSGVFDHLGTYLWQATNPANWTAPVAVDLDDDDDMEVIIGGHVYHHDGTPYWQVATDAVYHGLYAQVANFDADPMPEVLMSDVGGLALYEHDGTPVYSGIAPSNDSNRPTAIHDYSGDGLAEYGAATPSSYSVHDAAGVALWTSMVSDVSGQSGGTAFDFIGAGWAQAIYGDEGALFAFDRMGGELMNVPRRSLTQLEYPIVADVDNDGSAELVVVSNGSTKIPTVQVYRDAKDRWVPARRIWNQHTYHVTNVREDGTIPQVEPKHWQLLNTFRTQAQVAVGGTVCEPEG